MIAGVRDAVRFQGRVRRLPVLYAINLWVAGVIETVGAFVLLFSYSVIAGPEATDEAMDGGLGDAAFSIVGGDVMKVFTDAVLGPGTLLVVGIVVFVAAWHFGSASDEKFMLRQMSLRAENPYAAEKKQKLVDIAILVLTIIHVLPTLALSVVLIPEAINGGAPAPGEPWYMSGSGALLAVAVFGAYAWFGIVAAVLTLLRKRWAYHLLLYYYVFTLAIVIAQGDLVRASLLGKAVYVMPLIALWPLVRHLKVGVSISKSWRGMLLFLAAVWLIAPPLAFNFVDLGEGSFVLTWLLNSVVVAVLGVLLFVAYAAINRDPNPGWAELAAALVVGYPVINSLVGLVSQAISVFSTLPS